PGTGPDQVGDHPALLIDDHGAFGYAQHQVLAPGAVPVAAHAGLAVAGLGVRAEVEVEQGVHAGIDLEDHRAAATAVAAVGPAEGFELLPMHRGASVAAVAGTDMEHDTVDET